MGIDKLIENCDYITRGDASFEDIKVAVGLLENILTHIKDFADETNYSPVGYPVEYFSRNPEESDTAMETFCNILEEMESYFYN